MRRRERNEQYCAPYAPWATRRFRRPPRHWFLAKVLGVFLVAVAIGFALDYFSLHDRPRHSVGWIFFILLICMFIVRRLFRMRQLMRGVYEISNGNLEFQFEPGSRGEIGYLEESFNLMVQRVREMVQSKSQLLLDVSHELRSPLTRIKVALEMTPQGELKTSMMQDIAEMETMLTEILETEHLRSRNGQLNLAPVNAAALVREYVSRYKTRRPGVEMVGNSGSTTINADEARLRTVLQNVLENALKYSEDQEQPVQISVEDTVSVARIHIRDFGVGIPESEQERVFEPFYRVDKSRTKETGGYGLGLSLCREIMQAHGGKILLRSEPRAGTTVTLEFPKQGI